MACSFLALAAMWIASPTWAGGGPENALIVVNANSEDSVVIADEYVRLRGIPACNVVRLESVPEVPVIKAADLREHILRPLTGAAEERGIAEQIDYVIYSAGFPHAVDVSADMEGKRFRRVITQPASLTGATYFGEMVLADDTDYLALDANWYARRLKQERPDEPWDEADIALRSELHALLAQFRKAEKEARDAKVPLASEALAALARAAEILQQLSESHPANAELPYDLACIAALQGKPDEAMAALTAAYEAGWWRGEMADADRDLASLRERDDYKALLQQMREVELESEPPAAFSARKQWNRAGEPAKVGRRYVISAMLAHVSEKTNTREEALTGLRASVAADGSRPTGTVYYMVSKDRARTGPRQWAFEAAAKALGELGVQAEVIDGVLPDSKLDVVGAMIGIAKFSWEESGSTILPGAFCDHLTSFGGVMTGTNQTLLSELMRHGAAGACGTVKEPYNTPTKFPTPFMHVFYASGCSLGEAFYQSVKAPYQQLLVGDPLCQPWATAPVVSVKGLQPGATVKGTRRLTATAEGDQPVARYELFVDGVRRQTCLPGERIVLDARELADGEHEARVVAIAGPVETQGRAIIPFRVRREN